MDQFFDWRFRALETHRNLLTSNLKRMESDRDIIDDFLNEISNRTTEVEEKLDRLSDSLKKSAEEYLIKLMFLGIIL